MQFIGGRPPNQLGREASNQTISTNYSNTTHATQRSGRSGAEKRRKSVFATLSQKLHLPGIRSTGILGFHKRQRENSGGFQKRQKSEDSEKRQKSIQQAKEQRGSILSNNIMDDLYMGVKLDSRQVLKAFRYIGGLNGIRIEDLREHVEKIRNVQVRKPLLKDLEEIFVRYDKDKNGTLDVVEFERMVNSSTLLQRAVYEILKAEESDNDDFISHPEDAGITVECAEVISIGLVLLNVFNAAVAIDNSPEWEGWQWIELFFVCCFTLELVFRFKLSVFDSQYARARPSDRQLGTLQSGSSSQGRHCCQNGFEKLAQFALIPTNMLDIIVTILGWIEMVVYFYAKAEGRADDAADELWTLRRLRIFRLTRLVRLVRVIFFIQDLRTMLLGIISGMRTVIWGFLFIALIVFLWAIFLRQSVVAQWSDDNDGMLRDTFPSMPKSMLVVFRCMVLATDGTCVNKNESVVLMLSNQLGWLFDSGWVLTQVFVWFGIFNVVAAVFVVQACDHAAQVRESIMTAYAREDEVRLESLDKLLRTLIYPDREQSEPRDKYAAEVAKMVQKNHPDAAEKIPHLERQVVEFARGIQESKNLLQNAMNKYEAREVQDCRSLQNTPSAKTYVVDGEEVLCVCKEDASISNSCGLPSAPVNAIEVLLLQESETLQELLQEASELQAKVKWMIYPFSEWATDSEAGSSGHIWKQSKGLCDEAVDPGPKSVERAEQKVFMKYHGNFQRNRDYARLALIYDSVHHLVEALPQFLRYRLDTDGMKVVSVENRFVHPHPLGWRDITLLLKVAAPSSGRYHIMEIQMQLRGLSECKEQNHRIYEDMRAVLPEDVVHTILDRLVTDTTLDLGITKMEWTQCLHNKEVRLLLDGLGVPSGLVCRKRLFDLVDIDGSGTVTSSELQEIMRLYRTPAQALELAGCHLRVKEVQRHAQMKLSPQLTALMKQVAVNGFLVEEQINDLVQAWSNDGRAFKEDFHDRQQKRLTRYAGKAGDSTCMGGLSPARLGLLHGADFIGSSFALASFAPSGSSTGVYPYRQVIRHYDVQESSGYNFSMDTKSSDARASTSNTSVPGCDSCPTIPVHGPVASDIHLSSPAKRTCVVGPNERQGTSSAGDTPTYGQDSDSEVIRDNAHIVFL